MAVAAVEAAKDREEDAAPWDNFEEWQAAWTAVLSSMQEYLNAAEATWFTEVIAGTTTVRSARATNAEPEYV